MIVESLLKISWLFVGLALLGTTLNIYKNRCCFFIWVLTNSYFAIVDFRAGLYAQSALFGVYTILAIWGIYQWREGR